jgi:hypothetical protein
MSYRLSWKFESRREPSARSSGQRWSTFVRNHANAIVAGDFFTGSFRILHVGVFL